MAVGLQDQQAQATGQRIAEGTNPYTKPIAEVKQFGTQLEAGSPVSSITAGATDKAKQLFEFDKSLEGTYDPLKSKRTSMYGEGVVQHPSSITSAASSAITGGAGDVQDLWQAASKYRALEGSALVNAMNTIIGFVKTKEDRRSAKDTKLLNILTKTGGDYTDPDTGKTYHFQTPEEEASLTAKYRQTPTGETAKAERISALQKDVQNGVTFSELYDRYGGEIEEWKIREAYNAGPTAKQWGPAEETSAQLDASFDTSTADEYFQKFLTKSEDENEAKRKLLEFTQQNDSGNYESMKSYLDQLYPDKTQEQPAVNVKGFIQKLISPITESGFVPGPYGPVPKPR